MKKSSQVVHPSSEYANHGFNGKLFLLEKTLYAIDELTGLITATALVRPSKSIMDVKVKSVKKKWKAKQFSTGVDRSIIEKGAEDLGVELADLINDTIMGMREVADVIGLKGSFGE